MPLINLLFLACSVGWTFSINQKETPKQTEIIEGNQRRKIEKNNEVYVSILYGFIIELFLFQSLKSQNPLSLYSIVYLKDLF